MHFIRLDPSSPTPMFQQLHDEIVRAIALGDLPPGTPLWTVRTVAEEFGINPRTVQQAYSLLRENGVIETSNRKGSEVSAPGDLSYQQEQALSEQLERVLYLALVQGASPTRLQTLTQELLHKTKGDQS